MMHAAQLRRACLGTVVLLGLLAGCGGESSVSVGVPTDNNGPLIVGQVQMPNGKLAAAPSTWARLSDAVVARVEALVNGSVSPVGEGVGVRLKRIGNSNIVNGQIRDATTIATTNTAADGGFGFHLPTGTTTQTCRFFIEVGSGSTLTRAFVVGDQVKVDFESEAAVRLVLQQVQAGPDVELCDFTAAELQSINRAIENSNNEAFGDTTGTVNRSAAIAASSDPAVQAAIRSAIGEPTPVLTNTPAQATSTATVAPPTATQPPATVQPTRTNTVAPTRTSTGGPTNTVAPTRTDTVPPTRTNTPAPTNTTAPTNTAPPTSTATGIPTGTAAATATNTVPPTNTPVVVATNTPVPTNTTAPTNTPVVVATATFTATQAPATVTPTAVGGAPEINLGVLAGTAGSTIDVPVVLVAHGAAIAATSNDIEFDAAALSVALDGGDPDCTVDARLSGVKQVFAQVSDLGGGRQRLRVGVLSLNNNTTITSGALYSCRFVVAANAPASIVLENTPEAASPSAQPVTVIGSDGRIDVSTAPLALSLGTAAATIGGNADVTATLLGDGAPIAAISADIRFDATRLSAVLVSSAPDCTLQPGVAALGKTIATKVLPLEDGLAGIRVGVVGLANNTALPAAALFSCRFKVQSGGTPITLEHSPEGASPAAQPVDILGQPGTISIP